MYNCIIIVGVYDNFLGLKNCGHYVWINEGRRIVKWIPPNKRDSSSLFWIHNICVDLYTA